MKKKRVSLFIIFCAIFFAACDMKEAPGQTVLAPPIYHATIEYGEPDLITDNTGPLWAYIRFPTAGDVTDAIIEEWAYEVYQSALDEISALREDDPQADGEINIQFDSYFVDGRYAGILENGMFMSSHMANPRSIVRTFNKDVKNGTMLANSDILDYSQLEAILALLNTRIPEEYPEAVNHLGNMDEKWIEHIVIGHNGVIVILDRGKFLPTYLGTLKVTLPYDALGDACVLGAEPTPPTNPSTESPTEQPTATPTESPTEQPTATPTESPTEQPTATPTEPPTVPPVDPPTPPITESPTAPPSIPFTPPQGSEIDPSKPMIALTFDDGPSKYTTQVLDILEKYNARATFCVVGNLVNARKDTVKRAFDLDCEIIGHSWDHRDLSKLTVEEIESQLNDTSAVIETVTGDVSPKLFRPPYGAVSSTLKNASAQLGYAMINWSVDPEDWRTRNADAIYSEVMSNLSSKAIVLSHDLYGATADAYERIIPELVSMGYQLVTVSELMYYSGKTLEAGVVYYSGR